MIFSKISFGQNITFIPQSDSIYLNDGCTGVYFKYHVSKGIADSISIIPDFNTFLFYYDSLGNMEISEKAMFVVNNERNSNVYELFYCPVLANTTLIQPDSSFLITSTNYFLKLFVKNNYVIIDSLSKRFHSDWGLSVEDDNKLVKNDIDLKPNYPNPFNPTTTIEYTISHASDVKLSIYNILGCEVETLVNQLQKPGNYKVSFDGRNSASGIYFCRLASKNSVQVKSMLLIK